MAKEFKTGSVYESHYFVEEMNIIKRTQQQVINDWHSANIIHRKILLNTPPPNLGIQIQRRAYVPSRALY